MEGSIKHLTDFFVALGAERVPHTNKNYLAHVIAVHRLMREQGCTDELCRAGLFHSVYGTERFQNFKLPLQRRAEVRALIGERAERLAYLNCCVDRSTFDRCLTQSTGPYCIRDRLTGKEIELSEEDFNDLCRVHLYDFLEQVARVERWDYRRDGYRRMAARLGPPAQEAYDRVYAQEQR
jgi:hypothetical protein